MSDSEEREESTPEDSVTESDAPAESKDPGQTAVGEVDAPEGDETSEEASAASEGGEENGAEARDPDQTAVGDVSAPDAESSTSAEPEQEDEEASVGRTDKRWEDEEQAPVLKRALESLIFVSDKIVTHLQLAKLVKAKPVLVRKVLAEIVEEYEPRGIQLVQVGGGYQFRTNPDCGPFVRELVAQKPVRLTRAQLETLALVAYRQPITRPEVDEVRGVDSGSAVKVLLDRNLIKMLGRKDEAGRPLLYGTTPYFLEFFNLKGLKDLPTLKEFTELSDDSRALFKRKTGDEVAEGEEAAVADDAPADVADAADSDGEVEAAETPADAGEEEGSEEEDSEDAADAPDSVDDSADVDGESEGTDFEDDDADTPTEADDVSEDAPEASEDGDAEPRA